VTLPKLHGSVLVIHPVTHTVSLAENKVGVVSELR